ncbi:HAMP domain-containing histidine kinase [Halobacillus litoralis]|uniref:sensor histidine kinase n=1 Tax=Halobacillus litoralis TaxID=45668 RepID=UPI001CD77CBD|nr:HAMP domain-containing sensor histidine kinase [Halobacillus litoralis]MCA0970559.1 HAMP domain-containing histidine kinase [Halobacillus litoralis]
MKLSNKIHVYTTVLFVVLLVVIDVAVYISFQRILFHAEVEQAKEEARQALEGVSGEQGSFAVQDLIRAYVPPGGMIEIVLPDGQEAATVTGGSHPELVDEPSTFQAGETTDIKWIEETPYAFVSLPVIWTDGEVASLQLTETMASEADTLNQLRFVLIVVTLLAIIPLFISARLLGNLIINPITTLIQTMKGIRRSGQFKRIETEETSKDELYQMKETFNQMMDQLELNYKRQEEFISNASHELKTPLTIIESYSSLLKRRGVKNESLFHESVEAIHSEALRMKDLTQQLLLLAKQEEHWNLHIEKHAVTELLSSVSNAFEKAYGREVVLEVSEDAVVETDEQKLKQLLYILMDNARKYSDGEIRMAASVQEDVWQIRIIDEGVGIPEDKLPHVFERFYQVSESRNRDAGGYGLGLSLAKDLARALGGEVELQSRVGEGTTAILTFDRSQ